MVGKKSIPDRWLAYKAYGVPIEGTQILPFKVPLKPTVAANLPQHERFTPQVLIENFPKLKYIVDLTNTFRYYDPKTFTDAGIEHIKILIPGKEVPTMQSIKKFFEALQKFMSASKSDELIGIHCTHGINRTGYLICRYLVQQLGWKPQDSIEAFGKARGYPIERENYVVSLKESPRTKFDFSVIYTDKPNNKNYPDVSNFHRRQHNRQGPMTSSGGPPRRGFTDGRPYYLPPPRGSFGLHGPPPPPHGFGPRPLIPPPPNPPPGRLYGPRPHAYGMPPMRSPMPPPGLGPFPGARYPPRIPGPPGMSGPPRLAPPPQGSSTRLHGPGMGPPRLPPPGMGPSRLPLGGMRQPRLPPPGMGPSRMPPPGMGASRNTPTGMRSTRIPPPLMGHSRHPNIQKDPSHAMSFADILKRGTTPRNHRDMDFTVDTFDENLTTVFP